MKPKIITDSCCDLPEEYLEDVEIVPMTLVINGKHYKDGVDLSREEFFQLLENTSEHPGSASASPADFINNFDEQENIFVFTVSSALSSSYNNALLAKDYYCQQFADRVVYVFDSLNASIGQGLAILKLKELLENNEAMNNVVQALEDYIKDLKTFFVLEKMGNLVNSGRMNKLVGKVVSSLNIKLILGKSVEGKIELFDRVRGSRKAFQRLLKTIGKYGSNFEDRVLGIAHYNCHDKALKFKEEVQKIYNFREIIITKMGPTIATYADEDALLISF